MSESAGDNQNTDTIGDKIVLVCLGAVLAFLTGAIFYFGCIVCAERDPQVQWIIDQAERENTSEL
jgi:hypothetical protein